MKEVLISINPKWCELIASRKKTIEIRKNQPKIYAPFKVYIYCTKPSKKYQTVCGCMVLNEDELYRLPTGEIKHGNSLELLGNWNGKYDENNFLNGKVIGEFICNDIQEFNFEALVDWGLIDDYLKCACLTEEELKNYIGNKTGYAWEISNLVIYDKPRELSEFHKPCADIKNCLNRAFRESGRSLDKCFDCGCRITRPPQSWCYVQNS